MNSISVKNLTKYFTLSHHQHNTLKQRLLSSFHSKREIFKALDGLSFDVRRGEFLGIIGNNGSGKSTLLKILAGIYIPTGGKMDIKGRLSPFLELGVGFQMDLSAWENIFLYGALLGMSQQQIEERIDDIIAFSELEKFIDTKLNKFSSGMLVRLAFSTAIQADFDILLLDEVLAVGDYSFQMKCRDVFHDLRQKGKTVIFVSHDLEAVKRFCDRVIVLDSGQIKLEGTAKQICEKYLTEYATKNLEQKKKVIRELTETNKVVVENINIDTSSTLKIEFDVNFLREIDGPVVGLEIRNQNNIIVFSTNTLLKQIYLKKLKGRQRFVFEIEQKLALGKYFVSPAVCDATCQVFYDWQDDMASFILAGRGENAGGLCDFDHRIYVQK